MKYTYNSEKYKKFIQFIAEYDNAEETDIKNITLNMTVVMVADVFGKTPKRIAKDVLDYRVEIIGMDISNPKPIAVEIPEKFKNKGETVADYWVTYRGGFFKKAKNDHPCELEDCTLIIKKGDQYLATNQNKKPQYICKECSLKLL